MAVSVTLDSNDLPYGHYNGRHMTFEVKQTGRTSVEWTVTTTGGPDTNYSTGPTTTTINGNTAYSAAFMSGNTDATKPFPVAKGSRKGTATFSTTESSIPVTLLTWIYHGSGNSQKAISGELKFPYTRLVYKPGGATISSSTNVQSNGETYYVGLTDSKYISYSKNKNETEAFKQYVYYNGTKQDPYNYTTFNLVKTGYTFDGWSNSSTTSGAIAKPDQDTKYYADQYEPNVVNGTSSERGSYVTLTATWKANTYQVTFDANGGSFDASSDSTKTVTYDSTYGTLPTPKRTGYDFKGWYTSKSWTTKITSSSKVSITSKQTLYAKWETKLLEITLNKNEGTGGTSKTWLKYNTEWQNSDGDAITSIGSAPTRSGYTFAGYYTSDDTKIINANLSFVSNKLTFTTSDTTLYAHWTGNVVRIAYHPGIAGSNISSSKYGLNSSGYVALLNPDGTVGNWDFHTVTYPNKVSPKDAETDLGLFLTGHTFSHWTPWLRSTNATTGEKFYSNTNYDSSKFHSTEGVDITSLNTSTVNCYLRAMWTANTYYIKYNGNGSTSGSMGNSTHTYGESKNLSTNAYKKQYTITYAPNGGTVSPSSKTYSYTCTGWGKTSSKTEPDYEPNASVSNLTSSNNAVVNLYAVWKASASLTHPTPVKPGYKFLGWAKSDGTIITSSFKPTANITLTAQWEPYVLTINYRAGNGTQPTDMGENEKYRLPLSQSFKYGEKVNGTSGLINISTFQLTYTGHSATLWNTNINGTGYSLDPNQVYLAEELAADCGKDLTTGNVNIYLYPEWTTKAYTVSISKGTGIKTVTGAGAANYGDTVTITATASTGYTFERWSGYATSTNTTYTFTMPAWSVSFTASATPNTYLVTFDPGIGSVNPKTKRVTYDSTFGSPNELPTPKLIGHNFNGWYTDADSLVTNTTQVKITSDITLHAKWTIFQRRVTIDPNGGAWEGHTIPQSRELQYNETSVIENPKRKGYIFAGWFKTPSGLDPTVLSQLPSKAFSGNLNNSAFDDTNFVTGSGGFRVYDNKAQGGVTHTWITDTSAGYDYTIKINVSNGTQEIAPGLGGFHQVIQPEENAEYIHVFLAKIPPSYKLTNYSNVGDRTMFTWLTDCFGTGDWKLYAYKMRNKTSSGGAFGTFGHVALSSLSGAGGRPVEWYVGGNQITKNPSENQQFTMNVDNVTLTAQWIPIPTVNIYKSTNWKQYIPYIYVNESLGWQQAIPYIFKDGQWRVAINI